MSDQKQNQLNQLIQTINQRDKPFNQLVLTSQPQFVSYPTVQYTKLNMENKLAYEPRLLPS